MNEIYVVIMEGEVDEEHTTDVHGYFTDEASAIKYMLKECQSCYDDWRNGVHTDVSMDVNGKNCEVVEGVSGDYRNWEVVKLTEKKGE